ncbi:hypothetical protein BCR37DRAFT_379206 [Protomyces lactucae-debilis]|uniref:F-box domain-containing protein n=1 Tax=Protomyces lactucae-debilis TaxID=2754530 RepID=A0A1Y2FHX8_PROLT|nr:uncharacterized protein BCR37DRAFT_379206 [Protomyces lactucae-debilis]ORY83207.1 hypothetical protein BCR37DRAFT_379206 [Protomyces lactucae-debilis]
MSFSFGYEEEGDITTTADVAAIPRMAMQASGSTSGRPSNSSSDKMPAPRKQKMGQHDAQRKPKEAPNALEIEVKECTEHKFAETGLQAPPTPTYALRVRPTPKEALATGPSPVIASSSFFDRCRGSELDSLILSTAGIHVQPTPAVQLALNLPEIVEQIMQRLDDQCCVATSSINTRAGATRDKTRSITLNAKGQAVPVDWNTEAKRCRGAMFACLTVNSLFHDAARRALSRRVELNSPDSLDRYLASDMAHQDGCRDLLIHKTSVEQEQLNKLKHTRLTALEFYVCPQLLPPASLLGSHGQLTKLALPGCAIADDQFLAQVARRCPRLKILDLRACELVGDAGILTIARACRGLQYLNVGRVARSHRVTDRSIFEIARLTQIETLGVAGCNVGDEAVCAISEYRGEAIERLSLNACEGITDWSVGRLLKNAPKLQVLELIRCPRVADAGAILKFKRKSKALVEVDDFLQAEMDEMVRIRSLRRRTMPELGTQDERKGRRISTS